MNNRKCSQLAARASQVSYKYKYTLGYSFLSIRNKAASSWNFLQSKLNPDVTSESHIKAKKMLKLYLINSYKDQQNLINQSINQSKPQLYIFWIANLQMFYVQLQIDIVTYLVIFVGTTNSSSTDLEIATLCFSL